MNLDELLKVNSVRCIKTEVHEDLVEGEIYEVEGFKDEIIKIVDRNGFSSWHNKNLFEPVLNNGTDLDELLKHLEVGRSWKEIGCNHVVTITEIESGFANNIMVKFEPDYCLSSSPLRMFLKDFTPVINNDMSKSDSEIDISLNSVHDVNTTFKVGDKVYKFGETDVKTVLEMLSKLYPHIDFERPPLTGNELCRKLLNKGEKYIMAKDDTDTWRIICDYCDDWFTDVVSGKCLKNVTPVNSKGEPLTESVLDG